MRASSREEGEVIDYWGRLPDSRQIAAALCRHRCRHSGARKRKQKVLADARVDGKHTRVSQGQGDGRGSPELVLQLVGVSVVSSSNWGSLVAERCGRLRGNGEKRRALNIAW